MVAQFNRQEQQSNAVISFRVGINTSKVINKLDKDSLDWGLMSSGQYWQSQEMSVDELESFIKTGSSWMPGLLNGNGRKQSNVTEAYLLSADIDGSMTIGQALTHPFIQKYACLIITSYSHSEALHKFRVVFALPYPIKGWESIKEANTLLIEFLGVADKSCKDASRFYFGATNAETHLKQYVTLPENWLDVLKSEVHEKRELLKHQPEPSRYSVSNSTDLVNILKQDVYPRMSITSLFDWSGHEFKIDRGGKIRGKCPWHESQSGTAFYAQVVNGTPVWRCPACDIGGTPVEYRHRMNGGNGYPRGKDFVNVVKELASDAGVTLPNNRSSNKNISDITPEAILSAPETEYKDGLNPLYLSQRMQTRDQIIYYLNKGYGASELAIFRDGLESQCIKQFDWDKKIFPKLWEDTYAEFYATDEKPEKKSLISDTLTIKNRRLNIAQVVNPVLANAIRNFYAQLVPEDPDAVAAAFLLSFLGTLGSFCTIGTELIYRKGTKGTAKPNLYVGSVGYSGTAKSLITDILKFALGQFQDKEDERFNSRYQQWVEDGSKGEEPQRRRFLLQDCTTEALAVIQSQQPTKGLTSIQDEFAKFFKDQGKYKSGKSGDLDALLELKAGDSSIQVDRKGGRTPQERYVRCKKTSFSLIGGIQPDVLKALMGDFSDQSGFWARFLWMMVPRRSMPFPIDPETGAVIDEGDQYGDLINAIMPILQWIDSLPAHQYHLTEASKTLFAHWHNHLDDLVMANDEAGKQGLCAFYSKCKRTTAELALLLHLVDMACKANESGQNVVTTEIGVATMESAIRLMDYVISQALYVQSWGNKNAGLTTEAVAVIEFSRKKGFVSASNLMSGKELFKKKNKYGEPLWNTEKIRDLLVDLADMGLGTLQGEGKSLKFGAHSENEKVEGNWYVFECSSISETQLNQWVTEFVSKFSDISNFHPVSSLLSSGKGAPVIKGGELGSEGSESRNTNIDRGKPIKKNPKKPNSTPQTVDGNGVEGFGAIEIDPKDSNDFGNWWAEVSSGESRQPAPVVAVEETEPGEEPVEASETECEFKVGDTVVYDWKGMTEEQKQENVRIFKQDESTGYVTEYLGKTGEVVSFDTARFSNGRTVFKVIVRFEDGCELRCSLNELTKS